LKKSKQPIYICIASGPSLNQDQIDLIGQYKDEFGIKVIAINDNWKWKYQDNFISDHLYAADEAWWNVWIDIINKEGFSGQKWIPRDKHIAEKYNLHCIEGENKPGLGANGKIHFGGNSGYQAINLAYYLGAKTIGLLGYDMKVSNDKKLHWFGNHSHGLRNMPHKLDEWLIKHDQLSQDLKDKDIDVINFTPGSALYQYDQMDMKILLTSKF
jgi:hypothetical protein